MDTADAILRTLKSNSVENNSYEAANVVDALDRVAEATGKVARSICPFEATTGEDAAGGRVGCLTEAMMGVTAGLVRIADSISDLAEAVRERT